MATEVVTGAASRAAAAVQQIRGIRRDLNELPLILVRLAGAAAAELAKKLYDNILFTYKVQGAPEVSTMKKRMLGKLEGKTPRIEPAAPAPRFQQFGDLLESVKLEQRGPGYWLVHIANRERASVAAILEKGADWSFQPSPESFSYIMMIFNPKLRRGSKRARRRGIVWKPPVISVHIEKHPVWKPEFDRMVSLLPGTLVRHLRKGLMRMRFFRPGL